VPERHLVMRFVRARAAIGSKACVAMLAVSALALGCGCSHTETRQRPQPGTAFARSGLSGAGAKPMRPGVELGWDYWYIELADPRAAVLIDSVRMSGPGMGTVARVIEIKVAPLRIGDHDYPDAVPGGLYYTDPPVIASRGGCEKQELFAPHGYHMIPGSQARMYFVLRYLRPGKYSIMHQVIYYTQHGVKYKQAFNITFHGSVAYDPPIFEVDPAQAECVGPRAGVRLLSGWRLPKT
jgi:hypothetical protein